MNAFSSNTLLLSKWTRSAHLHDENHFLVTATVSDLDGHITHVVLQGLHNHQQFQLPIENLEDSDFWHIGWR